MRLLYQDKDGVGQVHLTRMHFAALRTHTCLIQTTEQRSHDHLLIAFVDLVELQDGTLARFEDFGQIEMLYIIKRETMLKALLDAPVECMDCTGVIGSLAIFIVLLLPDRANGLFQISHCPGRTSLRLLDLA